MDKLHKVINRIVISLSTVSIFTFLSMALVIVANVVMRAFDRPILGTQEIVGILMVVTVSFAIAYCALLQNHIVITIIITHLKTPTKRILAIITTTLSLFIWIIISWQCAAFALEQWKINEKTTVIEWPLYPLRFIFAFGLFVLCAVLVSDLLKHFKEMSDNDTD